MIDVTLAALLGFGPVRGRGGADLRNAIGFIRSHSEALLHDDDATPFLAGVIDLAYSAGVSRMNFGFVRRTARELKPATVGGIQTKNSLIHLLLAIEARAIAQMRFDVRDEVDALKVEMNTAFNEAEEDMAEDMDSMTYRLLVQTHAAVIAFLTQTARPLTRMLRFQFANVQPTLVMAQRLYGDASRADKLRVENKVIHPAFAGRQGRALAR